MKVTVVQFRTDQSGPHEVKCLYNACGLPFHDLTFINALSDDFVAKSLLLTKTTDLWILAGWGEAGFESTEARWIKKLEIVKQRMYPLIKKMTRKKIPVIGICFGFQLLVNALGGVLRVDKEMSEGGLYTVRLTDEGKKEKIFAGMRPTFKAVLGHKTSVIKLPEGVINLAYSEKCPIQAAKFSDVMYGFTFHPELNHEEMVERVELYQDYVSDQSNMKKTRVKTKRVLQNVIEIFSHLKNKRDRKASFVANSL